MDAAKRLEELLWNVSAMARQATQQTREHVLQRDAKGTLVPATQPEETTTSNLVRHLGFYGSELGVRAVLHTRALEGGLTSEGTVKRIPSGADLELAIEVAPRKWLDLLLQAKSFKPATGTYEHWSEIQNAKLVDWARAHNRTPGMLLYNDLVPPFIARPEPKVDFACNVFSACKSVDRVQLGWWDAKTWCHGPERTPAGLSMCLDQRQMALPPVKVTAMRNSHFQLEHLLHVSEHDDDVSADGTTLSELTRPSPPGWAADLLGMRVVPASDQGADSLVSDGDQSAESLSARVSAVIPFSGALDVQ